MPADRRSLVVAWHLSTLAARRLARAPAAQIEGCHDIDRALLQLLGARAEVRRWLRRPQPVLYHTPPLTLLLASPAGTRLVRSLLLAAAALARG